MSFLTPAILVGLAAIAIPILIHLIQREKKRIVEFPSLMFLERIPYQSVRRRRIRNWLLLLMRAAAVLLVVAAFARPFFRRETLAVTAAAGAREVVVLLDQSASMGYGDGWQRAQAAARQAVDSLGRDDRATLVLFARNAEENVRSTPDRVRLKAAIDAARVGSGSTEFGPALKLAQSILSRSTLARREAILISDFQKVGWRRGAEDVHFPERAVLTPVSVASAATSNVSVASVTFAHATFSGQERITVTAGVTSRGAGAATDVPVALEVDGHQIQAQRATIAANASTSVTFTPFTLSEPNVTGIVRAGTDALPEDNAFYFVLTPSRPVGVLVVDAPGAGSDRTEPSLYLSKALSIGTTPAFQVDVLPAARVTPADPDKRAVVILNDAMPPAAVLGVLDRFVQRGGGLLVVLGERSGQNDRGAWSTGQSTLFPGRLGEMVDRTTGRPATLGFLDYSHSIFELFKAPHSGDFSGARILRYRSISAGPADRVLARYDDGAVAAVEKRIGDGHVIAWSTSMDDSWNDLALKPVFLPLVHQMVRYLARYEEPAAWQTVGQALDLGARATPAAPSDRVMLSPSGERMPLGGASRPGYVELDEQGFYEVRTRGVEERRPLTIAVDLDPSESDLAPLDPQEVVATVTGRAAAGTAQPAAAAALTPQDVERQQAVWWYLLLAAILLLVAETVVSNRLSIAGVVEGSSRVA